MVFPCNKYVFTTHINVEKYSGQSKIEKDVASSVICLTDQTLRMWDRIQQISYFWTVKYFDGERTVGQNVPVHTRKQKIEIFFSNMVRFFKRASSKNVIKQKGLW